MNKHDDNVLRIGKISFVNLFPIYYSIQRSYDCRSFEFISGVPSKLNQLVRSGAIDLSPSSSIEYLRHPSLYTLINSHSISSTGAVGSINLFSRVALEALNGEEILTTSQSETSVVLLNIILKKFYALDFSLTPTSKKLTEALTTHKAYLLIGDNALIEAQKGHDLSIYDLGHLWNHFTGLPFVYALWIANKNCFADHKYELFDRFRSYLDETKESLEENLPHIALQLNFHGHLSHTEILKYWNGISYDLTEKHKKGLELFKQYALELGSIAVCDALV
jgi:chorismate dehydratase